jgi:hypothetical protein
MSDRVRTCTLEVVDLEPGSRLVAVRVRVGRRALDVLLSQHESCELAAQLLDAALSAALTTSEVGRC